LIMRFRCWQWWGLWRWKQHRDRGTWHQCFEVVSSTTDFTIFQPSWACTIITRETGVHWLLQRIKEVKKDPLITFTRILNLAAKSKEDRHQSKLYSLPTWKRWSRSFVRYNMKGLVP
jgi:hypothetical protein